ncbi:MAG: VWA domain-containing protein [Gammaproteobacteria bacterium HGW-Gammaproteobacteria-3]|nr:MAG: VWA domain-containing protein [Gammaproteobacteria bacterium HGW-Gammaproteobacteria-3]
MIKQAFKDYRVVCLLLALTAMAIMFIYPGEKRIQPVYRLIFIVDITRSMNATDYQINGKAVSRLDTVKQTLRDLLLKLPCQSEVGLGIFTERRSALLFEPLEICSSYAEIDSTIARLDWRMAWAADSRIAKGLLSTLDMLQKRDSAILFITDGQEAPPVNPRYRTDFSSIKKRVKGMIIGTGGLNPVPIPKFNANGGQNGFYTPDDVPHRSTFGLPPSGSEQVEGYNARNAAFGSEAAVGNEHLSALHESYLQQLAVETGLGYARLVDLKALETLQTGGLAEPQAVVADVRWRAALTAWILLLFCFVPLPAKFTNKGHQ